MSQKNGHCFKLADLQEHEVQCVQSAALRCPVNRCLRSRGKSQVRLRRRLTSQTRPDVKNDGPVVELKSIGQGVDVVWQHSVYRELPMPDARGLPETSPPRRSSAPRQRRNLVSSKVVILRGWARRLRCHLPKHGDRAKRAFFCVEAGLSAAIKYDSMRVPENVLPMIDRTSSKTTWTPSLRKQRRLRSISSVHYFKE